MKASKLSLASAKISEVKYFQCRSCVGHWIIRVIFSLWLPLDLVHSFFHTSSSGNSTRVPPNTSPVNSPSGFTAPSPPSCTTWPPWTPTRTTQCWRSWCMIVASRWVSARWAQSAPQMSVPPAQTAVSCQRRHEMLQMEPMNRLLECKWKKFAGPMFLLNFLAYLVYLCVFTVIAYNKKSGQVSSLPLIASFCALTFHMMQLFFPTCFTDAVWLWPLCTGLPLCIWPDTDSTGQLLFPLHGGMAFALQKRNAENCTENCFAIEKNICMWIPRLWTWRKSVPSCNRCSSMDIMRFFCKSHLFFLKRKVKVSPFPQNHPVLQKQKYKSKQGFWMVVR